MDFHWDSKPADPIFNQHFCNSRGFLVRQGITADDHYVLISVLGYRERTCYVHYNSFERSSPRSLDRHTGRTFLAPVFDIFATTDPIESLPGSASLILVAGTTNCNFERRWHVFLLVFSKVGCRPLFIFYDWCPSHSWTTFQATRSCRTVCSSFTVCSTKSPHYCGAYQRCV